MEQGGGFDGGARESVPVPIDPAAEHVKLVGALASASRVYRGVSF